MLTPTDLLAAGYRFHPPQGVDGPLYQKLFRGPAHEILYFVNITDNTAWLARMPPTVADNYRWSVKSHLYLPGDVFAVVEYSIRVTSTIEAVEAFYAHAFTALGCVPDPHN